MVLAAPQPVVRRRELVVLGLRVLLRRRFAMLALAGDLSLGNAVLPQHDCLLVLFVGLCIKLETAVNHKSYIRHFHAA